MLDLLPLVQVQVSVPAAPANSRLRRSFMATTRESSTVSFACQRYQLPLPNPPTAQALVPPGILPKSIGFYALPLYPLRAQEYCWTRRWGDERVLPGFPRKGCENGQQGSGRLQADPNQPSRIQHIRESKPVAVGAKW